MAPSSLCASAGPAVAIKVTAASAVTLPILVGT
jgi:hypothetical protein